MHALRLLVLTALLSGVAAVLARSVAQALRTGALTLRGGSTCRRATNPLCFWASVTVAVAALGVLVATSAYAMFLP